MVSLAAAWRTGRRERTVRPRKSLVIAAVVWAAKRLPTWKRIRTAALTAAGFGFIDYALWSWHMIAGCIAVGASLLILEALGGER